MLKIEKLQGWNECFGELFKKFFKKVLTQLHMCSIVFQKIYNIAISYEMADWKTGGFNRTVRADC